MATEAELLSSLGITDTTIQNDIISGTARLLVLDCSAHLDWDWQLPFPLLSAGGSGARVASYFDGSTKQPANMIFASAASQIAKAGYHFSICEMGFLRAFADGDPRRLSPRAVADAEAGRLARAVAAG